MRRGGLGQPQHPEMHGALAARAPGTAVCAPRAAAAGFCCRDASCHVLGRAWPSTAGHRSMLRWRGRGAGRGARAGAPCCCARARRQWPSMAAWRPSHLHQSRCRLQSLVVVQLGESTARGGACGQGRRRRCAMRAMQCAPTAPVPELRSASTFVCHANAEHFKGLPGEGRRVHCNRAPPTSRGVPGSSRRRIKPR